MIRVSVYYEDNLVSEVEAQDGSKEITIGRSPGCTIHLDEPSISRLHAVIRFQSGSWMVERKANFGAVLLNGNEVENAPLEGGEEIQVGQYSLRINLDGQSASPGAVATPDNFEDDGRTKFISAGVNALLRFEPGGANVTEYLIEGDVALFGRGSNCDVILSEKKASRKHFEIRREGLSFYLKDLNSANGTMVNGNNVTEVELVAGDVIQVGVSKIEFSVENKDFFQNQNALMEVPSHLQDVAMPSAAHVPADPNSPMHAVFGSSGPPGQENTADPNSAIPGLESQEEEPKSVFAKYLKQYNAQPRYRRILIVLVILVASLSLLNEEKKPVKKPKTTSSKPGQRTIEQLTTEKRKFVIDTYQKLVNAHELKEFAKMQDLAGQILALVDDYKDTKFYDSLAKKGIDDIEEKRKQEELARKQEETRKAVAALEEKGKAVYEKALNDKSFRPELNSIIQDIYVKDPNSRLAAEWKEGIIRKDEEDKRLAEEQRKKDEHRMRAEEAFMAVNLIFKEGKYIEALAEAAKLPDIGWVEEGFPERIEKLKEEIRSQLDSKLNPLLREAASQRQDGGDLVKANNLYSEVLKIDSENREALEGKQAIRDILHMRAKRFYSEAILAESLSDLPEAKDKYEKCLKTAPEKDIYVTRCRNKLSRFEPFSGQGGGY
ncbi:MAG: FHA domain-containing protein [Oligoflexia bacterium]|nr:FHA domain-containing protein [Oligoflexia bacterium]